MAIDRRGFLKAGLGSALLPLLGTGTGFAATAPLLSCYRDADGFGVAAFTETAELLWRTPLPKRGHGLALHPSADLAIVCARRPDRYLIALDPGSGRILHRWNTPDQRHGFGHAVFSRDGKHVFVTENHIPAETGVLGIYEVAANFKRIGEFKTHGIGPHEVIGAGNGKDLVIANGGILTDPLYPRQKLNLANMRPSLVRLDAATGALAGITELPAEFHQISLRHMAEDGFGTVWIGGQYEGPRHHVVPLVFTWIRGGDVAAVALSADALRALRHYVGSVTASRDGGKIALSSPRGGRALIMDAASQKPIRVLEAEDICGLAGSSGGFISTDGGGTIRRDDMILRRNPGVNWDNHMGFRKGGIARVS